MKKQLIPLFFLLITLAAHAQTPAIGGDWQGTADIGMPVRIVLHIKADSLGLSATMDSPDQNAFGLLVRDVSLEEDVLTMRMPQISLTYKGVYRSDQQSIEGDFSQGGQVFKLDLNRIREGEEALLAPKGKPQEPLPPYDYYTEELNFRNLKDDVTLSGTFSRPKAGGKYPVVLFISGSGPQDRDENILGHKPFLVIADYLVKKGFAVLRFDDRGAGKSTGVFQNSSLYDFKTDAAAGIDYLRSRSDVESKQIGLLGHSEGGSIALMMAAEDPQIAFIALLAAPGTTGEQVLIRQTALLRGSNGVHASVIDIEQQFIRDAAKIVGSKQRSEQRTAALKQRLKQFYTALPQNEQDALGGADFFVNNRALIWSSPWFSEFIKFDPKPYLRKIQCPVLAMNGTKDLQVAYAENLAGLKAGLDKGGNKQSTFVAFEGLNHLFQTAQTGQVQEYGTLEETFAPKALEVLGDWLGQEIRKQETDNREKTNR